MSRHGSRLVSGVRELLRTEDTILEDLHMVATDVVLTIDRIAVKTLRKLKKGQRIRCYDEGSNKEYGQKGSDSDCFFSETHHTKTRGTVLRVYAENKEWVVPIEYLLEVYQSFDPESDEGKKQSESAARPKRRGRKPKKRRADAEIEQLDGYRGDQQQAPAPEYEQEIDGEEYDFSNFPEEFNEYD